MSDYNNYPDNDNRDNNTASDGFAQESDLNKKPSEQPDDIFSSSSSDSTDSSPDTTASDNPESCSEYSSPVSPADTPFDAAEPNTAESNNRPSDGSYYDTQSSGYNQPGATYHQAGAASYQQSQSRPVYGAMPPYGRSQPYSGYQPYSNQYRQPGAAQSAARPDINNSNPPKKPHGSKGSGAGKKILAVVLAIVVIAASIGIGAAIGRSSYSSSGTTTETTKVAPSDGGSNGGNEPSSSVTVPVESTKSSTTNLSATAIAQKVRQSVVGVMSYSTKNGELSGEGSGVILCENDGLTYIITCAHVIAESGKNFEVMLLDGTTYDAKCVGYDERTDIGVLSVEETGLPIATFGDSSGLQIGETVYAIGNPGGSEYFGSMTSGIVSAIDRSISSTYTMTVIQHDAAINPGNSGGALVNTSGQVIGINSSKIADTDYEGMGFAIPTSTAMSVAESIIAHGYVPNRPKLGIKYSDVSNYQFYSMLVRFRDLPQGSLIISSISPDSDLVNTNVKEGDLIIAANGVNLDTSDVLLDLIESSSVGDKIKLTICRVDERSYDTSTFDVEVTLVEDKGSTETDTEEETTTATYSYSFGGSGDYEDFFRQFFGN